MLKRHLALTLTTTALLLGASPFSAVLAEDGTPPADAVAPESTPGPGGAGGPGGPGGPAGPGGGKGQKAGQMFDQADTNKDGVLTRDEMMAAHKKKVDELFDKLDADKSGTVTKQEVEQGREEIRKIIRQRLKERKMLGGGGGGDGAMGGPGGGKGRKGAEDGGVSFGSGE